MAYVAGLDCPAGYWPELVASIVYITADCLGITRVDSMPDVGDPVPLNPWDNLPPRWEIIAGDRNHIWIERRDGICVKARRDGAIKEICDTL